jgi:uroporphyrinogen decarboxylase
MNGKERISTVLQGGIPDRTPYFDFIMSLRFIKYMTGEEPALYRSDEIIPCCKKAGIDAAWIPVRGFMGCEYETGNAERYTDEFGTTFQRTRASWPVNAPVLHIIQDAGDIKTYRFPDIGKDRVDDVKKAVELANGEIAVFAGIQGPLRSAWFLMGFENICYTLADDPECLADLFQKSVDFFEKILEQLAGTGIDGIVISEDMGFSTSAFFSAEIFRKYLFPYQKKLMEAVKKHGMPAILHSDGNLNQIIDDLIAMGYDAYHPFERKAEMDIFAIRGKYPDTVLFGNIDSKSTLVEGDMDVIRRDAMECMSKLGQKGRYILSSDHSINDSIDPKTILALVEIVKNGFRKDSQEI